MVAAAVLSVIGLCLSRRFEVCPWEGWIEQLNVWLAATSSPGTRKSTVIEAVLEPVMEIEHELRAEAAPEIAKAESRRRILTKQLKDAEREASASPDDLAVRRSAERLAVELGDHKAPGAPRLVTTNATNEGLAKLLSEQDGRILIASGEGAEIFSVAGGLYSGGQDNYDVLLKGWSGDVVVVDRKHSAPVRVDSPSISMCLMLQPSVFGELAERKSFRGRGLLARFLFVIPNALVGFRKARGRPLSPDARAAYFAVVRNLLRRPDDRAADGKLQPRTLRFSPEGAQVLQDYFDRMEAAQREFGELEEMRDWASKAHGQVARVAAILHMAEHHECPSPWERPVGPDSVEAAVRLGDLFLAHTKAAFAQMGARPEAQRARRVLRYLGDKRVAEIRRRDLYRALASSFSEPEELDRALEFLQDREYVRFERGGAQPGKGGRPSAGTVFVNPKWLRQNCQNRQNPSGTTDTTGFGGFVSFGSEGS